MRTNQFTVCHSSLRMSDTPGLHFYDRGLTLKNSRLCNFLSSSHNPKRLTKQNLDIAPRIFLYFLFIYFTVTVVLLYTVAAHCTCAFLFLLEIAAVTSLAMV